MLFQSKLIRYATISVCGVKDLASNFENRLQILGSHFSLGIVFLLESMVFLKQTWSKKLIHYFLQTIIRFKNQINQKTVPNYVLEEVNINCSSINIKSNQASSKPHKRIITILFLTNNLCQIFTHLLKTNVLSILWV